MEESSGGKKHSWENIWETVKGEWKKVILAGISLLLFAPVIFAGNYIKGLYGRVLDGIDGMFGPQRGKIALAVFPSSTTSKPMLEGLNISDEYLNKERNWRLVYLREDGLEATEQDLLHRLEENDDIVLVVGHERSTTVKYLNERVYESDQFSGDESPIPLLLPAVTNPDITKSPRGGHRHILRLPATDDKQVDRLVTLLSELKTKKLVLVVDTSNRSYSDYIAGELISREPNSIIVDSLGVDLSSDGFSSERFLKSHPDTIIFIGMEAQASIFLRRFRTEYEGTLGPKGLRLIFTDGVAGVTFDKNRSSILREGDSIFLSGPFPAEAQKGDETDFPTYRGYAALARNIAEDLFVRANRRGGVSRANILGAMQDIKDGETAGQKFTLGKIVALFDDAGDNKLGSMHVWEVRKNGVIHSTSCACAE